MAPVDVIPPFFQGNVPGLVRIELAENAEVATVRRAEHVPADSREDAIDFRFGGYIEVHVLSLETVLKWCETALKLHDWRLKQRETA